MAVPIGIPDSVILDGSVGKVFAFSGNDGNNGASAVVAQLNEDLTGLVRVHVGLGSVGTTVANWNIHSGAFDDIYFGATPANGHLFMCGTATNNRQPTHYWIGFDAYPTMNATPDGSLLRLQPTISRALPTPSSTIPNLTLSGGPNDHDLLISGLVGAGANGYIITNDISTGVDHRGRGLCELPGRSQRHRGR